MFEILFVAYYLLLRFIKHFEIMNTRTLTAVIEKASDGGYGIYVPEIEDLSLYGYGETEKEAKEDLNDNLEMIIEHYRENNDKLPDIINADKIIFEYKYDISGFFKAFPIFNVTELANTLGINQSLLRQYKQGITYASPDQKKKIEKGIHLIAKRISAVRF